MKNGEFSIAGFSVINTKKKKPINPRDDDLINSKC